MIGYGIFLSYLDLTSTLSQLFVLLNIVLRDEDVGADKSERALYRVLTIPADHTDVSSSDQIRCEHLTMCKWKGIYVFAPSGRTWVFEANTLTNVERDAYTIESGKLRNKKTLKFLLIEFILTKITDRL